MGGQDGQDGQLFWSLGGGRYLSLSYEKAVYLVYPVQLEAKLRKDKKTLQIETIRKVLNLAGEQRIWTLTGLLRTINRLLPKTYGVQNEHVLRRMLAYNKYYKVFKHTKPVDSEYIFIKTTPYQKNYGK